MKHAIQLTALCTALGLPATSQSTAVFVNEFHYDNSGTDQGEFIEIAGPAGTDLTGWSIELYNGSNGTRYSTTALSGVISDLGDGFGVVVADYPTNGIQNGSPDGIALVNNGTPVQFLSYEGVFTAASGSGAAAGLTSIDIGVSENSGTGAGLSLQLSGTGSEYDDFVWESAAGETKGLANTGQNFVKVQPSDVVINEIMPNPTGTDASSQMIELLGTPGESFSGVLISIESDANAGNVDRLSDISGSFDTNGLLVANIPDLENPSFTLVLLESFSGSVGTDLDTDNDGTLDILSNFGTVLDAVGVPDSFADEITLYATELGGQDFAFTGDEPQLIFRERVTGDWYAVNDPVGINAFDIAANPVALTAFDNDPTASSFGLVNPALAVPVPTSLSLLALGLAGFGYQQRSKTKAA